MNYSTSRQLILNTRNFLNIKYYTLLDQLQNKSGIFYGWGRKKSGLKAMTHSQKYHSKYILLEDGFIRSLDLGVNGSPSFSLVEDDVGMYYDAVTPSKLENILNNYDFSSDATLILQAKEAIKLIKEHHISKYNNALDISDNFFENATQKKILIVAQTSGDASLEYGLGNKFTTKQIVEDAIEENPDALVCIKIHPDVLSGKKNSDIKEEEIPKECKLIDEDINPISLLKHFDKVYTKTSGMGMEALILGIEVVCYGMPYYAGWGLTTDKQNCARRTRKLSIEELFSGAYILYTKYYNPYRRRSSDIIDTIKEIILQKKKSSSKAQYTTLALGDSHIRIFDHYLFKYKKIYTKYVPGATALGVKNPRSKTGAYKKFLTALNAYNYQQIIVSLGEVDTSYTIWRKAEKNNTITDVILEKSINKYKNFLSILISYGSVVVLSAPLPTLRDNQVCDDEITGIRATVDASQYERTQLTLRFNSEIKKFCQNQEDIQFIDLDTISINKQGVVIQWLRNHKNPCDHHYHRFMYALLLLWRLKNVIK